MFCLSWKWRGRSTLKITERTREQDTEPLYGRRESRHPETTPVEQEPISKVCDEQGLQPTVFYRWQKELFENGAAAFQTKARTNHPAERQRIEYLEKKIQVKDEVLAELMAEHVAFKKKSGEL